MSTFLLQSVQWRFTMCWSHLYLSVPLSHCNHLCQAPGAGTPTTYPGGSEKASLCLWLARIALLLVPDCSLLALLGEECKRRVCELGIMVLAGNLALWEAEAGESWGSVLLGPHWKNASWINVLICFLILHYFKKANHEVDQISKGLLPTNFSRPVNIHTEWRRVYRAFCSEDLALLTSRFSVLLGLRGSLSWGLGVVVTELTWLFWIKFQGWRDGAESKNTCTCCSWRGSGLVPSPHDPHQVAHNQLQFQRIWCHLLAFVHLHIHALRLTHKPIKEINLFFSSFPKKCRNRNKYPWGLDVGEIKQRLLCTLSHVQPASRDAQGLLLKDKDKSVRYFVICAI